MYVTMCVHVHVHVYTCTVSKFLRGVVFVNELWVSAEAFNKGKIPF